jgi:hypothetical protein
MPMEMPQGFPSLIIVVRLAKGGPAVGAEVRFSDLSAAAAACKAELKVQAEQYWLGPKVVGSTFAAATAGLMSAGSLPLAATGMLPGAAMSSVTWAWQVEAASPSPSSTSRYIPDMEAVRPLHMTEVGQASLSPEQ